MLTIEVRDPAGQPLAQFAIFPMPALAAFPDEQVQNFEYLAQATHERFYFLVASDLIQGWRLTVDLPHQPSFKANTAAILGPYADHPTQVALARENYLASLVQTWLADLTSRWKSLRDPAPGEALLEQMGFLEILRGTAT